MKWFPGSVATAIQVSKRNNALLVVFIESKGEQGSKMKALWDKVDNSFFTCPMIGIHVKEDDEAAQQFSTLYPTSVLPVTYFIDNFGKAFEVVSYSESLNDEKFNTIVIGAVEKFTSSKSTSSSANVSTSSTPSPYDQMAEKIERAKAKLEEKKRLEEEEKKKEDQAKELERIQAGKLMQEAKRTREEQEIINAAAERRRDKLEAEREKERVKAQIKADREEREYRLRRAAGQADPPPAQSEEKPAVARPVASDRCRVLIRFPDNTTMTDEFSSSDKLQKLYDNIVESQKVDGEFSLVNSFPRKLFVLSELDCSFLELCLTPSCTLIVEKKRNTSLRPSGPSAGYFWFLPLFVIAPLQYVWNTFLSFFGTANNNNTNTEANATRRIPQDRPPTANRGATIRQRGNVARLDNNNEDADSDEKANWNGNSTQFM